MFGIGSRPGLVTYRALSDLVGKAAFFAVTVAAAHRLSAAAFGLFAIASTLGWMVAVATDAGIQLHVARELSRVPGAAADLLRRWLSIRVLTAGAGIAMVAVGLAMWPAWRPHAIPLLLFAVVYAVNGLIEFVYYVFRGLERTDLESSLTLWQRLGAVVCAVAVLTWRPTVPALAVALLLPAATTLTWSLRIAARLATASSNGAMAAAHGSTSYWTRVFPIGAGIALSALYFRIDVFLVERWRGGEAVGLYNAVFRLIEALRLFPAAVVAVTLPALVRAADTQSVRRISRWLLAFAIPSTVVLWATASWSVPLVYGDRYAAAVPAFRILTLCFPLFSLNYALTHQLIGWDGQRAYALVCAAALAGNLALNARLIPTLSIEGAAWATLWTEAIVTGGCSLAIWLSGARTAAGVSTVPAAS